MNTKNNRRSQCSKQEIQKALLACMENQQPITIIGICSEAHINRSTFYSHYKGIDDLLVETEEEMRQPLMDDLQSKNTDAAAACTHFLLSFLRHIRENQQFYQFYLQHGKRLFDGDDFLRFWAAIENPSNALNETTMSYCVEFDKAGFNSVVRRWVEGGCVEDTQEILDVLLFPLSKRSIG